MRLAQAWDPMVPGETDNLAIDMTADCGAATITSVAWTCTVIAYEAGTDPSPQARILSAAVMTQLQQRSAVDGSLATLTGQFATASFGQIPASMAGGSYILDAVATLSDGRRIARSAVLPIANP